MTGSCLRSNSITRDWAEYVGKNNTWPDADMLPLGHLRVTAKEGGGSVSKFTADEQQTMMTLWCIFRSPLIFGGDLPSNDAATTALITNDEVLAVDQHSTHNHQSFEDGNIRAWVADIPASNDHYVGAFNLGDKSETLNLPWNKLGIKAPSVEVRDLWEKSSLGEKNALQVELRPHASVLYRVSAAEY
jgi:alpha-galactosidase